jgi:hypothetical protein
MWKMSPGELLQLKGAGGERFAHFVDRLIRAEAAKGGLPQSEVRTQIRVNIKDGGVDTQVTQAIPRDQRGWFGVPTCWQFKAVEADDINDKKSKKKKNGLQEEINKPYVRELIAQGYAYRFCLLGGLSPPKLAHWEEQLRVEARAIRSDAPDPRVIDGGHLLAWAERFPAVVAWLRYLSQGVFHWEAWGQTCRAVTPHYVPNPEWEGIRRQIVQHADFNTPCVGGNPCLIVGGTAGVGKTRLVFETLNDSLASPGLVVYAADEQEAKGVATAIANTPEQVAILVADECSSQTRHFLDENLRGHVHRIRIICLDNMAERLAGLRSQVWLSADSLKNTDAILEANFPDVPEDRRRQYVKRSGGFVRLAAAMCQDDPQLARGDLSGLLGTLEQYVRIRLRGHLRLVSLLALFHKVGFCDEVQGDVEALCRVANCSRQDFNDATRVVKESPGFVKQAGRYWYITPEVVAQVLYSEGWERWVKVDPETFLRALPDHLQQQVIDQAAKLGGEEVRALLAAFFRGWFDQLTARDLADPRRTSLAAAIIQAGPEEYLPKLRDVIDRAEADDLMRIRGDWGTGWGPRRTLVWLLETMAAFPDFFDDCEACLFRLALHETEHQIGNSATEIWRNLFCIYLSGTAAPFQQRIEVLKNRISSPGFDEAKLAFRGLSKIFERSSGHIIGPPEFAGRIRPRDWQPASSDEERGCYLVALKLCAEQVSYSDADHRSLAFGVLVDHLDSLLGGGFLDEIARVLTASALEDGEVRRLVNAVDKFLEFEQQIGRDRANEQANRYIQEVRRWVDSIRPSDFDGKLRSVCARDPWDQRLLAQDLRTQDDEADELAAQIRSDPSRLLPHLDWLAGSEARSAERLGFALGRIDESYACGTMIIDHAIRRKSAPLLRGYVRGLVFAQRPPADEFLRLMRELEAAHPEMAVDVLVYGGDSFDALNRVVHLVESHAVSPRFLATFAMGIGRRELSVEEVGRLLPYFVAATTAADADTARAGVRFLFTYLMFEKRRTLRSSIEVEDVRSQAWRLADAALPYVETRIAYEWSQIVEQLAGYDLRRAAILFGRALLSESMEVESQAQEQLIKLASQDPNSVMEGFGQALLDPTQGWRLQIHVLHDLTARIPPHSILAWVRKHGINAARAIARHLPRPFLDAEDRPVVPEVLDVILREYDDDRVLSNFAAGAHSGESWWGDGSEQFRREAGDARRFLKHPNRRIRQWARHEIDQRTRLAEWEEREHAEQALP